MFRIFWDNFDQKFRNIHHETKKNTIFIKKGCNIWLISTCTAPLMHQVKGTLLSAVTASLIKKKEREIFLEKENFDFDL